MTPCPAISTPSPPAPSRRTAPPLATPPALSRHLAPSRALAMAPATRCAPCRRLPRTPPALSPAYLPSGSLTDCIAAPRAILCRARLNNGAGCTLRAVSPRCTLSDHPTCGRAILRVVLPLARPSNGPGCTSSRLLSRRIAAPPIVSLPSCRVSSPPSPTLFGPHGAVLHPTLPSARPSTRSQRPAAPFVPHAAVCAPLPALSTLRSHGVIFSATPPSARPAAPSQRPALRSQRPAAPSAPYRAHCAHYGAVLRATPPSARPGAPSATHAAVCAPPRPFVPHRTVFGPRGAVCASRRRLRPTPPSTRPGPLSQRPAPPSSGPMGPSCAPWGLSAPYSAVCALRRALSTPHCALLTPPAAFLRPPSPSYAPRRPLCAPPHPFNAAPRPFNVPCRRPCAPLPLSVRPTAPLLNPAAACAPRRAHAARSHRLHARPCPFSARSRAPTASWGRLAPHSAVCAPRRLRVAPLPPSTPWGLLVPPTAEFALPRRLAPRPAVCVLSTPRHALSAQRRRLRAPCRRLRALNAMAHPFRAPSHPVCAPWAVLRPTPPSVHRAAPSQRCATPTSRSALLSALLPVLSPPLELNVSHLAVHVFWLSLPHVFLSCCCPPRHVATFHLPVSLSVTHHRSPPPAITHWFLVCRTLRPRPRRLRALPLDPSSPHLPAPSRAPGHSRARASCTHPLSRTPHRIRHCFATASFCFESARPLATLQQARAVPLVNEGPLATPPRALLPPSLPTDAPPMPSRCYGAPPMPLCAPATPRAPTTPPCFAHACGSRTCISAAASLVSCRGRHLMLQRPLALAPPGAMLCLSSRAPASLTASPTCRVLVQRTAVSFVHRSISAAPRPIPFHSPAPLPILKAYTRTCTRPANALTTLSGAPPTLLRPVDASWLTDALTTPPRTPATPSRPTNDRRPTDTLLVHLRPSDPAPRPKDALWPLDALTTPLLAPADPHALALPWTEPHALSPPHAP
ncbi:hypothetical protein DENSPDRAFT_886949 [Dentipellis sp. KUC8613]|nr:hypothetical protein DENSPDRAFT_886949 [Dentipellis sp. KUC8613]